MRHAVPQPNRKGALGMMPGSMGKPDIFGLKAVSVFSGNLGTPFESHQGAVLLFEAEHGQLLCVADASSITTIRTAAASAVATRALAKKGVAELAILGSGTQASSHLEAMLSVQPGIRRVRVWSRNRDHAKRFAAQESSVHREIQIEATDDAKTAAQGAELICTTTGATSPILKGEWLFPGVHVNAVGASRPPSRELDTNAVAKSRFYVDSRESALNEADDFLIPKREGAVDDAHIRGEIGDVLEGKVEGRTSAQDITVFKSLGIAVEDLAAANYVYTKAPSMGIGTWVEFSPERHLSS